jgi:DNA-binding FadR family transcriptional regulator
MQLQAENGTMHTVWEAREIVEPTLAALAARRRTDEQAAELNALAASLHGLQRDSAKFQATNRRFHDLVAVAAGNELFAAIMPSLSWMAEAVGAEIAPESRPRIAMEKTKLAEAIEQRDSWLASQVVQQAVQAIDDIDIRRGGGKQTRILWADVDELLARHADGAAPVRRSGGAASRKAAAKPAPRAAKSATKAATASKAKQPARATKRAR